MEEYIIRPLDFAVLDKFSFIGVFMVFLAWKWGISKRSASKIRFDFYTIAFDEYYGSYLFRHVLLLFTVYVATAL